jgi:nucleoside-diphosphate-sugar epimerase
MAHIAITGAGGYIGSVLIEEALKAGHDVTAIDRYFFGINILQGFSRSAALHVVRRDIRDIEVDDFAGIDFVIDLAALTGDPACDLLPELAQSINVGGRSRAMAMAKAAGVKRYVLASSCSVYGYSELDELDELSPVNPLSHYARSMLTAEENLFKLGTKSFCVTAFRNATVFGLSRRMRFDLVANVMTKNAVETGKLTVTGGGQQWRPLVHVRDLARCFLHALKQPKRIVNAQTFNIGLTNIQMHGLADMVRTALPVSVVVEIEADTNDHRSYNVSFNKMRTVLGYKPRFSVAHGVDEIYQALKRGNVDVGGRTSTVGWYKHLMAAQNLVNELQLNGRVL